MYIYPHKDHWASEYAQESEIIFTLWDGDISLFHIGSTAVKGLVAKDCIDILGVVNELSAVKKQVAGLVKIGYVYKGAYGIQGREYFSKRQRKVHFHIFPGGEPAINKYLKFVAVMGSNPELVSELNFLKHQLHEKYPHDKDQYQAGKICFYDRINATS